MEIIQLSMKEGKRIQILEELKHKKMTQSEAAIRMNISLRQTQRISKRYFAEGVTGLVHKSRGKASKKRTSQDLKNKIIRIVEEQYTDFGPTLASEMLEERHNIKIHKETLRRIMLSAGLWHNKKKRSKHRTWRIPKDYRGEMIQVDVSLHQWFEDRAPWCSLVKFVDDATKEILYAKFIKSESYKDVTEATIEYFKQHGLPQIMYSDKGKVFKVNTNNENVEFKTQYEYALELLGVELIHAHSPQAKGRIERSFQTDQDRLVKMMRIENISTIDAANKYLHEKYIPTYNNKFTRPAKYSNDLHVPLYNTNLYDIFCIRTKRIVQHDWTIRYNNRILQITKQQSAVVRPKDSVLVLERLDGTILLQLRSFNLNFKELAQLPVKKQKPLVQVRSKINTPWRKSNNIFYQPKPETRHFYDAK